jgi:hypothetical protein
MPVVGVRFHVGNVPDSDDAAYDDAGVKYVTPVLDVTESDGEVILAALAVVETTLMDVSVKGRHDDALGMVLATLTSIGALPQFPPE